MGAFWLVDEHSPSIIRVLPEREGVESIPACRFDSALEPAIRSRTTCRKSTEPSGSRTVDFEGVTSGWDMRTIYAALQSPLSNPTAAIGNASRNTRILAMDAFNNEVKGGICLSLPAGHGIWPHEPHGNESFRACNARSVAHACS